MRRPSRAKGRARFCGAAERLGVRCELFGGLVSDGFEAHALSGRIEQAGEDLVQLGEALARSL